MSDYSHVANAHPSYIEAMYKNYQQSPGQVEKEWRLFLKALILRHLAPMAAAMRP